MEKFVYRRPNHLSHLERLRDHGKLCDVTIQIDEQRFNAHRLILVATVPFFEKMFTTDCREQKDGLVVLKNIKANNMELFLMFAYRGEINLNKDNAESLMFDADFLGLTDLVDQCAKFLETCIDTQNVLSIKKSAELLDYDVLQEKCINYILQNFLNFTKTEQFLRISIDDLEKIINKSEELEVASEARLYRAMMRWLEHDVNERKQYLPRLLKCVRLTRLSAEYLINDILRDELIATSEECKDIINEVIYSRIILNEQSMPNKVKTRENEVASSKLRIVLFSSDLSSTLMYNPVIGSWETIETNMIKEAYLSSTDVLNGKLYAISYHLCSMSLAVFDSHTCSWEKIYEIESKICCFKIVALGDYLYICSGEIYGGNCILQRYCPQRREWKSMAPMNISRAGFQAVACQGHIYVCGGHSDENSDLTSIECYDPSVDQWTIIDISMKKGRSGAGMVVLNNKIYICGGYNQSDDEVIDTVEVFDPKLNTVEYVANMNSPRALNILVAYQGKLWAIGGHDNNNKKLSSVELYDPERDSWQYDKSLPTYSSLLLCGGIITIH